MGPAVRLLLLVDQVRFLDEMFGAIIAFEGEVVVSKDCEIPGVVQ